MRVDAVLAVTLLVTLPFAGCLADDAGSGGTPVVTDDGEPSPTECPYLDVRPDRAEFRPGERVHLDVVLVNCTNATLTPTLPYCPKPDALTLALERGGDTWFLGHGGLASRTAPEHDCDAFERSIPPGETFGPSLAWDGRLDTSGCAAMRCAEDAWAPHGTYTLRATLTSADGTRWNATETIRWLAPEEPPYRNDGAIVFLLDAAYAAGESVAVTVRNDGDTGYRYRTHYAACDLAYFNATGYPFIVPEGTHCDIANDDVLEPGETVTLFTWDLDQCVRDNWGCSKDEPLPPGTYHLGGTFHEDVDRWWEKPDAVTHAGTTFRIT